MKTHILFDLDGTLTDPFEGITNSILYALHKMGIAEQDRHKLTAFIGPPLLESFQTYYGLSPEQARRAVALYREYYARTGIFENAPYPGIFEALGALKSDGCALYVATSKPEPFAERIIEKFGFSPLLEGVAGATLDETRTQKAEVIAYALSRFHIPKADALMAGDRRHDVLGAKENGIPCVGVLYGFGSREELLQAGAVRLAAAPQELPACLSSL